MYYSIDQRHATGNTILKILLWLVTLAVVAGAVYGTYAWQHHKVNNLNQQITQLNSKLSSQDKTKPAPATPTSEYSSKKGVAIKVYTPARNSTLTSPVVVMGEVPGNWSFEATFPVKLIDSTGNVIAQAPARLLGNWMTNNLVPFTVTLPFTNAPSGSATLTLLKDNPSGLAANDDSLAIPMKL